MKKIFILAVVFILGIFTLASCNDTEVDTDGDKNQTTGEFVESDITQGNKNYIVSLSVDTSQAKVDYYLTEEFDSNNVKVTANYRDSSSADITSKVTFDSSSFNNQEEGVYNIGVSYIDDEQQLYTSYNVTVNNILSLLTEPYIVGLNLDLSTIKTNYQHGEEIEDYSNLKTTLVLSNGTEQTITKEDANLTIDTSNVDMNKAGFYDVLVSYSKTYTTTEGFSQTLVVSNYYKLQVIDPVTTLTFVSGNTVVDQYQNIDTSDWILKVTYESGSTLEISGSQVKVVLDSSVAGVRKATASYTEYRVTVSCEVEITVNEVAGVTIVYTYNANDLPLSKLTSNLVWNDTDQLGVDIVTILAKSTSTKVVVDGSKKSYGDFSFTQRLKLGGAGKADELSITIDLTMFTEKSVTIEVYALSGSSDANRKLDLYNGLFKQGTLVGSFVAEGKPVGADVSYSSLTVDGGSLYSLGSPSSGVNIYGIVISIA